MRFLLLSRLGKHLEAVADRSTHARLDTDPVVVKFGAQYNAQAVKHREALAIGCGKLKLRLDDRVLDEFPVDQLEQKLQTLSGERRDGRLRCTLRPIVAGGTEPFQLSGLEEIDFVPNVKPRRCPNTQTLQHALDGHILLGMPRVRGVGDVENQIGVGEFFERGAKCRDQMRRRFADEANRVGKEGGAARSQRQGAYGGVEGREKSR